MKIEESKFALLAWYRNRVVLVVNNVNVVELLQMIDPISLSGGFEYYMDLISALTLENKEGVEINSEFTVVRQEVYDAGHFSDRMLNSFEKIPDRVAFGD